MGAHLKYTILFLLLGGNAFCLNKIILKNDSVNLKKGWPHFFCSANINVRNGLYDAVLKDDQTSNATNSNPYAPPGTQNTENFRQTTFDGKITYKKSAYTFPISFGLITKNTKHIFIISSRFFSVKSSDLFKTDLPIPKSKLTKWESINIPYSIMNNIEFNYLICVKSKKVKRLYIKSVIKYRNFHFNSNTSESSSWRYNNSTKLELSESKKTIGVGLQKNWCLPKFGVITLSFMPALNYGKYNYLNKLDSSKNLGSGYTSTKSHTTITLTQQSQNKRFIDFNFCLSLYLTKSKYF